MLPGKVVGDLRAGLKGRVIAPDDPGYDEARTVFYGGIDRRPAAIAMVADAADVARVVAVTRETGLELAVRGGGHSFAGHSVSDGGIVLDLRGMRALDLDAERRAAWAEAGLQPACTRATPERMSTSWARRAKRGSARPIRGRPGIAWSPSSAATTRLTSSG